MKSDIELSVALEIINRKIAKLNIKMVNAPSKEVQEELDKYLEMKKEINNGNLSLIEEIIGS